MKIINSNFLLFSSIILFCGVVLQNSKCTGSKRYQRYLAHIFNTYGNGGSMSFEGLEHLMHNLGLGGQEFSPTHTIAEHRPDGYKMPQFSFDDDDYQAEIQKGNYIDNLDEDIDKSNPASESLQSRDKSRTNESPGIDELNESSSWIQPGFKEMHDPKHRHPRHYNTKSPSAKRCLSPAAMIRLVMNDNTLNGYNRKTEDTPNRSRRHVPKTEYENSEDEETDLETINSMRISPLIFMEMCPALLVQIDQEACAERLHDGETNDRLEIRYAYAWMYSTIAVLIISCCGLFGVAIIPLAKTTAYEEVLKFLVAIAVGTLCGDAFMHLLPHALMSHDDEGVETDFKTKERQLIWLCGCAFLTSIVMYSLEILLPFLKGSDVHSHSHNHSHSNHHSHHQPPQVEIRENAVVITEPVSGPTSSRESPESKELSIMLEETKSDQKGKLKLSPVAFMVLLGDGIHNITDGLAIGAAFATDPITGMATAFAVLCHELPHELGDFALLLKTGVSIQKALLFNIGSSILSFLGMAAGLLIAGLHTDMVRWIYASTAGSFLYIALTDLIPEIKNTEKHDPKGCFVQIFGVVVGGGIMMLIALHEDQLRILFE